MTGPGEKCVQSAEWGLQNSIELHGFHPRRHVQGTEPSRCHESEPAGFTRGTEERHIEGAGDGLGVVAMTWEEEERKRKGSKASQKFVFGDARICGSEKWG